MNIAIHIGGTPFELASILNAIGSIQPTEQITPGSFSLPAITLPSPVVAEKVKTEKVKPASAKNIFTEKLENAEAGSEDFKLPENIVAAGVAIAELVGATEKPVKFTVEVLREIVQKKAAAGKRDEIKAILADFSAGKVTDLKQEDYIPFYTRVEKL